MLRPLGMVIVHMTNVSTRIINKFEKKKVELEPNTILNPFLINNIILLFLGLIYVNSKIHITCA